MAIIDPYQQAAAPAASGMVGPSTQGLVDPFQPAGAVQAAPAAPARGGLAEIGTGLARGALSGLPTLAGQALQHAGADSVGGALTQFGKQMGEKPSLTLHPEAHGGFVNTLAEGAEQLAPAAAPALALGAGAAALGAAPLVATAAGAVGAAGLFAGQAGQSTLEKAQAKSVDPEVAHSAAALNAAQTFATQTALGFVGGKMLGTVGSSVGKMLGKEGAPLAEQVLGQMTGSEGVVKPFLKALPVSAAEMTGTGLAQVGAQAAIENSTGIDDTNPLDAMKEAIPSMLGLTAVMTPLGLAGRALGVRSAKARTDRLGSADTAPEIRTQLADQYSAALAKANPEAAQAFRENAQTAIENKLTLPVDPTLFEQGVIQPPAAEQPTYEKPPLLPAPADNMVAFPDGTVGRASQIDAYINGLPEEQRVAARAKLYGYGAQDVVPPEAGPAGPTPLLGGPQPEPLIGTRSGEVATQAQLDAYINGLPENERVGARAQLMGLGARDAEAGPVAGLLGNEPTPPAVDPLVGTRDGTVATQARIDDYINGLPEDRQVAARAQLMGLGARDVVPNALDNADGTPRLATPTFVADDQGNVRAPGSAGSLFPPDPNLPKLARDTSGDVDTVLAAQNERANMRTQDVAQLKVKINDLTGGKGTLDEQIAALRDYAEGKSSKLADRVRMVADQWEAERPREPAAPEVETPAPVEAAPEAAPEAEPAAQPAAPARGLGGPRDDVDVVKPYPARPHARELGGVAEAAGRKSATLASAASRGDFKGVVDSLATSKAPIIAHLAKLAQKFVGSHKIVVDDDFAGETQQSVRQQEQTELHGAAQFTLGKLRASRAVRDAMAALPDNADRAARSAAGDTRIDVSDLTHPESRRALDGIVDENGTAKARDVYQRMASLTGGDPFTTELTRSKEASSAVAARHEQQANDHWSGEENLGRYAGGQHIVTLEPVAGRYEPESKTVRVKSHMANSEHVIGHELMHALTHEAIDRPTKEQRPVVQRMQNLYEFVRDKLTADDARRKEIGDAREAAGGYRADMRPREHYGVTSLHEFVAEGHTNASFQRYLRQLKYQNTSAWGKFTKAIADLMGVKHEDANALTELLNLHEELQGAKAPRAAREARTLSEPPPQAAVLGENIAESAPDTRGQPPAAAAAQRSLTDNTKLPLRERVIAMRDRMQEVMGEFHNRLAAGEQLSPSEKERYDHVRSYRQTLQELTGQKGRKVDEGYINDILGYASQAENPYPPGFDPLAHAPLQGDATRITNPSILKGAGSTNSLQGVLTDLAKNGSSPATRELAKRLGSLGLSTRVTGVDTPHPNGVMGEYYPARNEARIYPNGMTEHTVLHEAVHAAQEESIARGLRYLNGTDTPVTQAQRQLMNAVRELQALHGDVMLHASADSMPGEAHGQYGLTNIHEFMAEANSNPEFQQFLRDTTPAGQTKSFWQRLVDGVKKLFGMQGTPKSRDFLEMAMDLNAKLEGNGRSAASPTEKFNHSPAAAAGVVDDVLSKAAKLADRAPIATASREVFKNMLGWKTVDFISHQVSGVPELVASGFHQALENYRAARDSRRIVSEHLGEQQGKYTSITAQALRKTGDPRGWGEKMMRIGGESSIGGFDYRKNYAENRAENKSLDASPDHVNAIHREFTQLQKAQPELAKLLVQGEQHNRKSLVMNVASIASNLMSAYSGVVPRLEAELSRMPPDDAGRARLVDRLQTARTAAGYIDQHMRGLDFMDKSLSTARNAAPDFHLDGTSSELAKRLSAAFAGARSLPEGDPLRSHLAELEQRYTQQVKSPYFSLGRDGDHYVNIAFKGNVSPEIQARLQKALDGTNKVLGDLTNQTHAFFRVDTLDQAQGLYNKLVKAGGGDAIDLTKSSRGRIALNDMREASGVTPALRQLESALHDSVDINKSLSPQQALEVKQTLTRQLLSMLPESSARSAKMQRRGVPGYDADFVGNFAKRASGGVQDLANGYTNRQFAASLKGMQDAVRGLNTTGSADNAARAQMVTDEINKRYANGMKRIDNSHINLLNSLGHSFYLAVSPAFFIRTMAQPYHRGLPILGARYGFVNAAKEIGAATGTSMKIMANSIKQGFAAEGLRGALDTGMRFDNMGLSAADQGFVQEMHDRGVLKLGQAQQLQNAITGESQRRQDIARAASMTAQYAEMTNRLAVGLAAFRMASRDKGMTTEAATDWAHKAINNAMDNFDSDNTARQIGKHGIAGKVTPLLTSFMNYSLQTMQQIARTVQDGMFGQDKSPAGLQRAKEARKEFAGLMGTTAMISGALGLPFANAFAGVYNMLTKDSDDPSDIRGDVRNWLNDTLGSTAGGVAAHGIGGLINMDTSTFGLENLLPGSEFLASRQQLKDKLETQSQQLLGPALNAAMGGVIGLGKIADGNYVKGIEAMLPSGIKPYYKAAELAGAIGPGGYTDSKGNPIEGPPGSAGIHAGAWDIGLQAAGFRTAEKATHDEASFEFSQDQQQIQHRREVLGDRVFKAYTSQDQDKLADVMADVREFNQKNPLQPITNIGAIVARHMQATGIGVATGTNIAGTRRQYGIINNKFGYAAMPAGQ
jgi:hypothetical protein